MLRFQTSRPLRADRRVVLQEVVKSRSRIRRDIHVRIQHRMNVAGIRIFLRSTVVVFFGFPFAVSPSTAFSFSSFLCDSDTGRQFVFDLFFPQSHAHTDDRFYSAHREQLNEHVGRRLFCQIPLPDVARAPKALLMMAFRNCQPIARWLRPSAKLASCVVCAVARFVSLTKAVGGSEKV